MNLRMRSLVAGTVLSTALLVPTLAHAQANEAEAKVHYQKGVELYNESAYTAALEELEKAYALSPHYRVLYSLALVRAQLSDFVGALRGFQEYEAAAVDEPAQRKAEVRERIEALQQKVASLQIKVNLEDSEVYIDDQLKGTSPFDKPILVNPGKHTLYAKKGTKKSEPKVVTVAAGSSTRIAFELEGVSSTNPSTPSAGGGGTAPKEGGPSTFVIVGGVATGILAAGAITTGILTLGARSSLKDAQESPAAGTDLTDKHDKISTFALTTDILGGAAIVVGAVTLVAYLRGKKSDAPATTASTWVTATPRGIGLGGRF